MFDEGGNARYIAILTVIGIIFFFARSWEPYITGDSLKHALVAKEMLFKKNWLDLYLYNAPYLKKPPFYFWLIALSYKIFGISTFAARFFPAFIGILDAFLVFYIAKLIFKDHREAFTAALFFIINWHVIRLTSIVRMESTVTFFILLNFYFLLRGNYLSAGIPLGLGILTKGPVALLGLISFLIWKILKKDLSFFNKRFVLGLLAAVVVSLPWYLYQWETNRLFFKEFVSRQIIARINGTLPAGDKRNYLFYFKKLLVRFWPGLPFFIIGLYRYFKRKLYRNNLWMAFGVYLITVFIIINIPDEKFTRYLYYLYPIFSIFCVLGIKQLKWEKVVHRYVYVVSVLYVCVVLFYPKSFHHPFHQGAIEHKSYSRLCSIMVSKDLNIKTKGLSELENCYFYFHCVKNLNKKPAAVIEKMDDKLSLKMVQP